MNFLEWLREYMNQMSYTNQIQPMQQMYSDALPFNLQFPAFTGRSVPYKQNYDMKYGTVPGTQDPGLLWYPDLPYWFNDPNLYDLFQQFPKARRYQS